MLIYIVEDDSSIQKLIAYALKSKDYDCEGFINGGDFFQAVSEKVPDLVLLDIMLPDMNGTDILKRLRHNPHTADIPIMMLTAKTSEYDIVTSLDIGADDYMTKPFSVLELLSRVNALLRRNHRSKEEVMTIDGVTMDLLRRTVTVDGEPVVLAYKEFELLKYMMINAGIVLSRDVLLNAVWGYDYQGETRTVDMHIKLLRERLGNKRHLIHTVRGIGYKLAQGADDE